MPEKFKGGFGRGGEISRRMEEEKRVAPFENVENKVLYVNPNFNSPFKLREGEKTPLGLFLRGLTPLSDILKSNQQKMEIWPGHLRSALLARVIFSDKEGNIYRDIDLKGTGSLFKEEYQKTGKKTDAGTEAYYGLLDKKKAFREKEMSEKLLSLGVSTSRALAIIELQDIILDEKKISWPEAKKKLNINSDFQPAILARAFSTKARIWDLYDTAPVDTTILQDAKEIYGKEKGKNLSRNEDYFETVVRDLAKNVALLHKNGLCHGNLIGHNITLDARITDLATVKYLSGTKDENQKLIEKDKKDVHFSILNLTEILHLNSFPENLFEKEYNRYFTSSSPTKSRERG